MFYPENMDWDSSVEAYIEILREVFLINENERKKIYEDMILIINTIEYGYHVNIEVLKNVFAERDTKNIDDNFLNKFKQIPILKVIIVQSILSKNPYNIRNIELQKNKEAKYLIEQYIATLSITPNIFDSKYLSMSMRRFLLKNIKLLLFCDFERLSLSSLLLFEEALSLGSVETDYWRMLEIDKIDKKEFMISLIREEVDEELGGYRFRISGSFVKFFTLKLIGRQGEEYLKVTNDKYFKDDFKFSLLTYLKRNKLTLDTYLDEIEKELETYDNLMVGIYEKELIKREVEKIVFENYSNIK